MSKLAIISDRIDSFRGHGEAVSLDYVRTDKTNSFVRGFQIKPKSHLIGPAGTAIDTPGWGLQHKEFTRKNFGHIVSISSIGEQLPDKRNCRTDPAAVDHYGRLCSNTELGRMISYNGKWKETRSLLCNGASNVEIDDNKHFSPAHIMGTCVWVKMLRPQY
jgi:hypothetical protein